MVFVSRIKVGSLVVVVVATDVISKLSPELVRKNDVEDTEVAEVVCVSILGKHAARSLKCCHVGRFGLISVSGTLASQQEPTDSS